MSGSELVSMLGRQYEWIDMIIEHYTQQHDAFQLQSEPLYPPFPRRHQRVPDSIHDCSQPFMAVLVIDPRRRWKNGYPFVRMDILTSSPEWERGGKPHPYDRSQDSRITKGKKNRREREE
jgi:hypothetical protein